MSADRLGPSRGMRSISHVLVVAAVALAQPAAAQPRTDADEDRDGFAGDRDRCPDRSETFNGYDDEDGCPDTGQRYDAPPERDREYASAVARRRARIEALREAAEAAEEHGDDAAEEYFERQIEAEEKSLSDFNAQATTRDGSMLVAGITLTVLAGAGLVASVALIPSAYRGDAPREGVAVGAVASLCFAGIGIPLIVVGSRKARGHVQAHVGPRSVALRGAF